MFDDIAPENAPFDGRWWSPDDPSEIVGGRIALIDGIWELSINGWLGAWTPGAMGNLIPPVIHGLIGTSMVTLLDLVLSQSQGGFVDRPFRTRISANVVLIGTHGTDDLKFTGASVRHHNLEAWANRNPWTTTFGTGHDPFEATIAYKDPGDVSATLPGASLSLTRSIQLVDDLLKAELRSYEWIHIEFDTPLDRSAIEYGYVRPLGHLLELASSEPCPLLGFNLVPENAKTPSESVKVLSALHRGTELTPKTWFRLNFNASDIRFEEVVSAWWHLQAELGVTTDLLASIRSTNFIGNTFLNAATAIESYHRHRYSSVASKSHVERLARIRGLVNNRDRSWLNRFLKHSHEPNYAQRIDKVVVEAGSFFSDAVGNPTLWRDWIVRARNGVAHRDPSMINVDQEWLLAIRIAASIQLMMSVVLMKAIGVPPGIYEERIRESGELRFLSDQFKTLVPGWFA